LQVVPDAHDVHAHVDDAVLPNLIPALQLQTFEIMVKNKKNVAMPAKVKAHSGHVAEYFT